MKRFLILLKSGQSFDVKSENCLIEKFLLQKKEIISDEERKFCIVSSEISGMREIEIYSEPTVSIEEKEVGGEMIIDMGEERARVVFRSNSELEKFLSQFSKESLLNTLNNFY